MAQTTTCAQKEHGSHMTDFTSFIASTLEAKFKNVRNFLKNEVIAALLCSILQRRQAFGNLSN